MKVTVTVCPPVYKGAQTPGNRAAKSAIKEQPVAKMHTQILENYRAYKKIYEENQTLEKLSTLQSPMNLN